MCVSNIHGAAATLSYGRYSLLWAPPSERVTCVFVQLDNQPDCAARVVVLTTGAIQSIPCASLKEACELRDQLAARVV
jgi:hypothetical protein